MTRKNYDALLRDAAHFVPLRAFYVEGKQPQSCTDGVFTLECADPEPLGMQDERILNSQITASSVYSNHHAINARLNWQPNKCWITYDPDSWLQVSFGRFVNVVQVLTQGRWGDQTYFNWVKSYYLSYGNDGLNFYDYAFQGNTKV